MCCNTLVTIHFIKCRVTLKVTGDETVIEEEHLTVTQESHCVNLIFLHFPRRLRGIRKKIKFLKVDLSCLKALQRPHWASCGNWNTAWRTAIKCQVGEKVDGKFEIVPHKERLHTWFVLITSLLPLPPPPLTLLTPWQLAWPGWSHEIHHPTSPRHSPCLINDSTNNNLHTATSGSLLERHRLVPSVQIASSD